MGIMGEIINECNEIFMTSPRRGGKKFTNISMDKLKYI